MTIWEHLAELRTRLLYIVAIFLVAIFVSMLFYQELGVIMSEPHRIAIQMLERETGARFDPHFIAFSYTGPFTAYFKLSVIVAIFVSFPFVSYHIWKFVAVALHERERNWVLRFGVLSYLMFLAGCVIGYFVLLPYLMFFLISAADLQIMKPVLSFPEYIDYMILMTVITGLIFQIPVIMMFLSAVGLVGPAAFSKFRKYVIVLNFFIAAFLTPGPDAMSQLALAIPMCALYEFGILLARLIGRSGSGNR